MLNKEVLIMPTEHNETAKIGVVNGHTHTETTVNGKKEETEYYFVDGSMVDASRIKEVGDSIAIDNILHTIDDISVMQGQIILKNEYDNEKYTFEPTDIYYCEDCDALHFSDAPMVDDLEESDEDDEELSDDFILGHMAGYITGAKDMYDHYEAGLSEFTVIDEALDRIGLDFANEIFDTERLEDISTDELIEFYNAVSDVKEERDNHVDEDTPIPQYTHEELVKLIGHEFSEA
jgi:hypothetical protein